MSIGAIQAPAALTRTLCETLLQVEESEVIGSSRSPVYMCPHELRLTQRSMLVGAPKTRAS